MKRVLLFVLLGALAGCGGQGGAKRPPQMVKTVLVGDVGGVGRDYVGMATADHSTNLAFKVGGQVTAFDVSDGEYVRAGRVVAEINPRDYQLAYDAARATYLASKSQYERAERLLARQAISQSEYETARNNYIGAESAYRNAGDVLQDTKLRTPIAGIVEKKYVDTYQRVGAGEVIVRIVDPVTRTVKFTMPESGIALLERPTLRFSVVFDSYPEITFSARLKDWIRTSPDGTGVPVSLAVDMTEGYVAAPGMACTIHLEAGGDNHLTVVPLSAVFTPDTTSQAMVWRVVGDRVEATPVVLGALYGVDKVVAEGLQVGDRVVTAGVHKLSNGQRVTLMP